MNTYCQSYKLCYKFMNAPKQTRKTSRNQIQEEISEEDIRIRRHEKLIHMIKMYKRTSEEEERLIRIRNNTILQIELRFRKSQISEHYVFPKMSTENVREDEGLNESIDGPTFYNLYSQNQISIKLQKKHLQNSPGRRIKSLDGRDNDSPSKVEQLASRKIRNQNRQIQLIHNTPKKIQRSVTQAKNLKLSPIAFPNIKKKEKIKTELQSQKDTISNIFSQKLLTEQSKSFKKKISLLHKKF